MYVAIIIPNPLAARCGTPPAITGPHEGDNVPYDEGNPQSPVKRRRLHEEPGRTEPARTVVEEPSSATQKYTHQTKEAVAPQPPKGRDEPQASNQIDARTLQQQPQVLIASLLGPSACTIGTRIALDETDVLHVKTGGIAMIYVRYRVEKLVKGAENQDARTA